MRLRPGHSAISLLWAALLCAGCASHRRAEREAGTTRLLTPQPPSLLTGPLAALLASDKDFSAQVTLQSDAEPPASGILLARTGQLLFAPELGDSSDKRVRTSGFSFVWDTAQHHGYLLCEALQGYAPIVTRVWPTNVILSAPTVPAAAQKIAGHSCELREATVQMSDGSRPSFQVWQATDLKAFPVRINAAANPASLTVTLTKLRVEVLSSDLFVPPDSFSKYESPDVMADELVLRQHNLRRKSIQSGEPLDLDNPASSPGYHR